MRKLLVFVVMVVGYALSANADIITITTSCGKIAYINSEQVPNMEALLKQLDNIEFVLCGGSDTEEENQPTDPSDKP